MKAQETTFRQLVQGEKQFQVPLYQRTYNWTRRQWERLWGDVLDQAEEVASGAPGPTHFLGSVVLAPSPDIHASGVQRWLVVDGQQRLTTIMLALCAVRDHLALENPTDRERINEQYLTNKWKSGDDFYRLLPTTADRPAFFACVDATPDAGGGDNVGAAYRFFRQKVVAADDPEDPDDVRAIERVLLDRLALVEVTAHPDDNVHRIFESLNNTGLGLTQADLLRNHLFMLLPTRGEHVYRTYWLPMQERLSGEQLELLVYLDLVLRGVEKAKRDEIYRAQQVRMEPIKHDEAAVEGFVRDLARRARHLERLVAPACEPDPAVRAALERLQAWGALVTYPALMHLLDLQEQGKVDAGGVAQALGYVESFLVRRMIAGVPTNNLNRIFNALVGQLPDGVAVPEAVRYALSGTRKFWPTDKRLAEAVATKPFYWQGRPEQRLLVLRRLEESYPTGERVDFAKAKLTVEHVLPQTPTPEWLGALAEEAEPGETPEQLHALLVQTLGNLTLTAYNAELSNHPFERKQDLLRLSNLEMNKPIAAAARWGKAEIRARAEDLARRAAAVWPGPAPGAREPSAGRDWTLVHQALAALPAGSWTTYTDLAELVGSHPMPVGVHLAGVAPLNAHRALAVTGKVSKEFCWPDRDDARDPRDVLREEGVRFDDAGAADPSQRMTARDLAVLVGIDVEDAAEESPPPRDEAGELGEDRRRFAAQLAERQGPATAGAVERLLDAWVDLGGHLSFGKATETSCFLDVDGRDGPRIWPLVVYPSGFVEVVFQHLARRPPFDDATRREELRRRLCEADGVDLPAAKVSLRPSFSPDVLTDPGALDRVVDALAWFRDQVLAHEELAPA